MRARELGIPKYNEVRRMLNLEAVTRFSQISNDSRIQVMLESLYSSVEDIDAFVGCISEDHNNGTEIGPTFTAAITQQFERIRDGDRLWYENSDFWPATDVVSVHGTKIQTLILRNFDGATQNSLPLSSFFVDSRQLLSYGTDSFFPTPLPPPPGLLWTSKTLAPAYLLHWVIDFDTKVATIQIQVKTLGWAGIGFGPSETNTMKGADIVFCHTEPVECTDNKALDVGVPTNDLTIGGSYDLMNVTILRSNSFLTVQFSRLINTGDGTDQELTDQQRIIFAFHPFSNDFVYHGPTRNSSYIISWLADAYKPPIPTYGIYVAIPIGVSFGVIIVFLIIYYFETRPLDLSSLPKDVQVHYSQFQSNPHGWKKHGMGHATFYLKSVEKRGELWENLGILLKFLELNPKLEFEAWSIYNSTLISSFINFRNILTSRFQTSDLFNKKGWLLNSDADDKMKVISKAKERIDRAHPCNSSWYELWCYDGHLHDWFFFSL
eukprot:TRINITY_DN4594_c0_g1_i1.p1 TRINITY_DN4594_c0_g1~~TRINITY_DN4594_c0_g1_i1.p1  ORF type:complete len:492 (-),score=65.79 TRINITY_DN4594_c0_g1_i1:190-1665(-)